MSTNWENFLKHNFIRNSVIALLFIFIIIVCFGLLTNKHIKIFGIEFNSPALKDENIAIKKDSISLKNTSYKPQLQYITSRENTKPQVKEQIKIHDTTRININGKNINTGTNNGSIGDIYNEDVAVQRVMTQSVLSEAILWVEKMKRDANKTDKNVFISYKDGDYESSIVAEQLRKYLQSKGYIVDNFLMISNGNTNLDMYPFLGPEDIACIHINPYSKLRK